MKRAISSQIKKFNFDKEIPPTLPHNNNNPKPQKKPIEERESRNASTN
jgi:hypothetical protein